MRGAWPLLVSCLVFGGCHKDEPAEAGDEKFALEIAKCQAGTQEACAELDKACSAGDATACAAREKTRRPAPSRDLAPPTAPPAASSASPAP